MRPRPAFLAIVIAAVAALGVVGFVVAGSGGDGVPALRAATYPEAIPAPATLGADHRGEAVQVPRPGRPAVVTFLFADCPDVCPAVSQQISLALDAAGPAADGIDVVAISVDPAGDTPDRVTAFLDVHRLTGRMRYLVGTRAELEPVWKAWSVLAQPAEAITQSVHTARVVLVDAEGRQVASYPGGIPFSPDDLAADIRSLTGV